MVFTFLGFSSQHLSHILFTSNVFSQPLQILITSKESHQLKACDINSRFYVFTYFQLLKHKIMLPSEFVVLFVVCIQNFIFVVARFRCHRQPNEERKQPTRYFTFNDIFITEIACYSILQNTRKFHETAIIEVSLRSCLSFWLLHRLFRLKFTEVSQVFAASVNWVIARIRDSSPRRQSSLYSRPE